MSLVDYASSSDDDVSDAEDEHRDEPQPAPKPGPSQPLLHPNNQRSASSSIQELENAPQSSLLPIEKLPDASLLLDSPTLPFVSGTDHASRVAAAMAASASRKRESDGLPSSLPRPKVPRGSLPHTRNVPDTGGGLLVPPQLSGRSNVVTEDFSKLFVRRHAEPSSH